MFKLLAETGDQKGAEFSLREGDNVVGRSRDALIRLTSSEVSSLHARFSVQGDKVIVFNISQFGTWVENRKLQGSESAEVQPGKLVRIGKHALRLMAGDPPPETIPHRSPSITKPVMNDQSGGGRDSLTAPPRSDPDAGLSALPPGALPATGGGEKTFEQIMRAKAEQVDLTEDNDDSSGDKTHVQKTVFVPKEELERRLVAERKKSLHRQLLILGASVVLLTVLFVISYRNKDEGKIIPGDVSGTNAPRGAFEVLYPKNDTSRIQRSPDGMVISTLLGQKRDVRLVITLQQSTNDIWATQDNEQSVKDWMKTHADWTFGLPFVKFEGRQNGVRVWTIPYARKSSEALVGEARVFFNGRLLAAISAEVPAANQGRAENIFKNCTYFEFLPGFEESCWAGMNIATDGTRFADSSRIDNDLSRVAPLTWAAIARQLQRDLSLSVANKDLADEERAMRQLMTLRQQQARWFNSQRLLVGSAQRFKDKEKLAEVSQRCQAVFSDPADNRYFEVRKW